MLKVSDRVKQNKLNYIYKIWNDTSPVYLKEHFHRICDTELRNCTRASFHNSFVPRVYSQASNTFFYSGIKDWNFLPANIKQIESFNLFKERVKQNILLEARDSESCPFLFYWLAWISIHNNTKESCAVLHFQCTGIEIMQF